MSLTETFLELAPEFGGTRFGPFTGMEIRLGSDPGSNDIVLPENLGVLAQHVKLIAQGNGSFIVAPIERTAGVFVYRAGSGAKQVTSPIAVQGGSDAYSADAFALVTPEGPKFYVLQVQKATEPKSKQTDFDRARKRLSGGSLLAEVKRQGIVMFLTTNGGSQIQRWGTFVRTGAIFRPRYLIGGAVMMAGWLFTGGMGLVACNAAMGQVKLKQDYDTCQVEKAQLGGDEGKGPSLDTYAGRVMGVGGSKSSIWKQTLRQDTEFADAFRNELKVIFASEKKRSQLTWVYKKRSSDFVLVKKAMEKAGWPPELVRVMAYTAAIDGAGSDREWTFIEGDSAGGDVCGRGPLAMTWRQAEQLGVQGASIDASMPGQKWFTAGDADKVQALKDQAATLRNFVVPEDLGPVHGRPSDNMQDVQCLFNGDEDVPTDPRSRDNLDDLIGALNRAIGPSAKGLPGIETNVGMEARLLKFFAADYGGDMSNIDLSRGDSIPSLMLNEAKKVKPYAMQRAAETLAKAVAIPCLARQDPGFADLALDKTIGEVPEPLDCIIIEGMLKYGVK